MLELQGAREVRLKQDYHATREQVSLMTVTSNLAEAMSLARPSLRRGPETQAARGPQGLQHLGGHKLLPHGTHSAIPPAVVAGVDAGARQVYGFAHIELDVAESQCDPAVADLALE